jgi:hypothetical protein
MVTSPLHFEDNRAAEILADARAIIAGEETAEEREARLARAKARRKALPKPVAQVTDPNDLVARRLAAKIAAGERLTREDRIDAWWARAVEFEAKLAPLLKAGKVRGAIMNLMTELASSAIAAADRADRLEDRLAALEAAAKTRRKSEKGTGR